MKRRFMRTGWVLLVAAIIISGCTTVRALELPGETRAAVDQALDQPAPTAAVIEDLRPETVDERRVSGGQAAPGSVGNTGYEPSLPEWEAPTENTTVLAGPQTANPITAEPVVDWAGIIASTPAGAQFDDYFEWQSYVGGRYGISALDPAIQARIEQLRDTGRTVRIWGTLRRGVPDVNGTQILVSRLETQAVPPAPLYTETSVVGWTGVVVKMPTGGQVDDYFARQDGEIFGIAGSDDSLREQVVQARWTGATVAVWGRLLENVPDAGNRQIQLTRLDVLAVPEQDVQDLTEYAVAQASSELPRGYKGTCAAWFAVDGKLETAWTENAPGPGVGEWIELSFPGTLELHSIGIDVGYDKREDLFYANHRLKRARLVFENGEMMRVDFADKRGVQRIPLARAPGPNVHTTSVRIIIEEVYPGTTYDDTCLSQIQVWGRPK